MSGLISRIFSPSAPPTTAYSPLTQYTPYTPPSRTQHTTPHTSYSTYTTQSTMIADDDEIFNYLTKCRQLLMYALTEEEHSDLREVMFPALAGGIKPRPDKLRQLMHLYHNIVLEVCDWMVYSKGYPHILIETYFTFDAFLQRVDEAIIDECHGVERVWSRRGSRPTSLATVPEGHEASSEHSPSHSPSPPGIASPSSIVSPRTSQGTLPLHKGLANLNTPPLTPPESAKQPTSTSAPESNTLSLNPVPEPPAPESAASVSTSASQSVEDPLSPKTPQSPSPASSSNKPSTELPSVPPSLQMSLFDDDMPLPTLSTPPLTTPTFSRPTFSRPRSLSIPDPVSIMITPSSATPSFASSNPKASPLSEHFKNEDKLTPSFPPPSFVSRRPEPQSESRPVRIERPEPEPHSASVPSSATNSPRIRPMSSSGSLSHHWWQLGSRSRRASAPVV